MTSALDAAGGTGTVTITTQPECAWTASTQSGWISDLSPTSGQGNGQITFRATANSQTSAREGEIVINDARARVTQQGSPCRYDLSPGSREFSPGGGSGSFDVVALAGCSWTATSTAPWISITGNASGSGNGAVSYSVQANSGAPRSGGIALGNQTFLINQESGVSGCAYNLSSSSIAVPAGGSSGSVTVTAGQSCAWMATSSVAWVTVTSGTSGTGNGAVSYGVQANTGTARSGTISIAGKAFTVNQADGTPSCAYQLSATGTSVSAAATSGSVNVTAGSGCAWSAVSNASWITVTGGTPGSGSGAVTFSVAANNTASQRSGTITIDGQTYTVEQAAQVPTCNYQLSSTSVPSPIAAAGGSGSFDVVAATGCAWTATTTESWITFSGATTGSGNGSVSFTVAANTAASTRSGVISVQGQTFTVNQAAAAAQSCTYQLSPPSVPSPIAAAGGSGSFNVTAAAGCGWTATTPESWISFSGATTGSGNGSVSFTVAANTAASTRSGVISVQGQTFTVNQAAAAAQSCTYQLSPPSVPSPIAAAGGSGSFNVIAPAGCGWTASTMASWISFPGATTGSGNGSLSFTAAANSTTSTRSGTITVQGQTFTVNQAAAAPTCNYSLSSSSASVNRNGNPAPSFRVNTEAGCPWTAISNAPWITVNPGAGTGSGTVRLDVAVNPLRDRSGTVTVEGQTFTVNQDGSLDDGGTLSR
jgi:hypothetical protein